MAYAVAIDLPLEAESARRAREQLAPFAALLDEASFFDLRLLVSELVAEALNPESQDPGSRVGLRAELNGGGIHVEVTHPGDGYRAPAGRPEPGEPGWALYLAQQLRHRWTLGHDGEQAVVSLEIP
jgi:hypothetical protein